MCFDIQEDNDVRRELLDFTTDVIVQNGSSKMQNQAKTLMASLFSSKNDFFDKKVRYVVVVIIFPFENLKYK